MPMMTDAGHYHDNTHTSLLDMSPPVLTRLKQTLGAEVERSRWGIGGVLWPPR